MSTIRYVPRACNLSTSPTDYKSICIRRGEYFFVIDCRERRLIEAIVLLRSIAPRKVPPFFVAQLMYGDVHIYQLSDTDENILLAVVERKTHSDLISSIKDRRIDNVKIMVDFCCAKNAIPILVIENVNRLFCRAPSWGAEKLECRSYLHGVNDMAIRMSITSLTLTHRVVLLMSTTQVDTIMQLAAIVSGGSLGERGAARKMIQHTQKPISEINIVATAADDDQFHIQQRPHRRLPRTGGRHMDMYCFLRQYMNLPHETGGHAISLESFDKYARVIVNWSTSSDFVIFHHNNNYNIKRVIVNDGVLFLNGAFHRLAPIDIAAPGIADNLDKFGHKTKIVYCNNQWCALEPISVDSSSPLISLVLRDILLQQQTDGNIFVNVRPRYHQGEPVHDFNARREPVTPITVVRYFGGAYLAIQWLLPALEARIDDMLAHSLACLNKTHDERRDVLSALPIILHAMFVVPGTARFFDTNVINIEWLDQNKILINSCSCKNV